MLWVNEIKSTSAMGCLNQTQRGSKVYSKGNILLTNTYGDVMRKIRFLVIKISHRCYELLKPSLWTLWVSNINPAEAIELLIIIKFTAALSFWNLPYMLWATEIQFTAVLGDWNLTQRESKLLKSRSTKSPMYWNLPHKFLVAEINHICMF